MPYYGHFSDLVSAPSPLVTRIVPFVSFVSSRMLNCIDHYRDATWKLDKAPICWGSEHLFCIWAKRFSCYFRFFSLSQSLWRRWESSFSSTKIYTVYPIQHIFYLWNHLVNYGFNSMLYQAIFHLSIGVYTQHMESQRPLNGRRSQPEIGKMPGNGA